MADVLYMIDEQVDIALSRFNFWEFCLLYDADFFSRRPFLKQVATGFQSVYDGSLLTISVSMPPRAGKSYVTSLFCAWWLGKNPLRAVMRNTVTSSLYRKFSYDVRNIIKDRRYQKVFPEVELASDKQNIDGWSLTVSKQGAYFGGGVGTNIIGFGANLAISDDLYSGFDQALSENYNESVFRWKQGSHDSRKEKGCAEIYIGTRWSKNDVIGEALESGKIQKEITIPALNENNQSFCEDVKSTEEYLKVKEDTEESIWAAEYMQEPAEISGLLFPKSALKFDQLPTIDADHKYMYVDNSDTGDYTAAPICYLHHDRIYIVGVVFNNHGTDISIPTIVEHIVTRKMNAAGIEGNSGWILYARDVKRDVLLRGYEDCDIRVKKNQTHKETRIKTHSPFIKNHCVFLREELWDKEYKDFMKNLNSYLREGGSKHDDAADSLAGVADYFKREFGHLW